MTKRHPKPTEEQKVGRIVRRAADLIEDRGWVRGQGGNKTMGFCVLGSIRATGVTDTDQNDVALELENWLRKNGVIGFGTGAGSIPTWNDRVAKDKEEVILWMRKAADEMDPQWI